MKTTTTPEPATSFVIRNWVPRSQNTLCGFATIELPSGLVINGISLHEKNGSRWVSMPAREYIKDSERTWSPVIEFTDRDVRESFQALALEAIDQYLREESE
jgi:DNA-binding cell septation regulator SpoVG